MPELTRHIRAYTVLALILSLGTWGMVWFAYDRAIQTWIALSLSVSYSIWGIVHHTLEEKFNLRVFLDYLAISFFGFMILISLLYRA